MKKNDAALLSKNNTVWFFSKCKTSGTSPATKLTQTGFFVTVNRGMGFMGGGCKKKPGGRFP